MNDQSVSLKEGTKEFQPFKLRQKIELVLKALSDLMKEINLLKQKNIKLIKKSKNTEETYILLYSQEIYDELLEKLYDGLESGSFLREFMDLGNTCNNQLINFSCEESRLKEKQFSNNKQYINSSQKYLKLGLVHASCNEITESIVFALLLFDEFCIDRDKYEINLWNMAIGNYSDILFVIIPQDLLQVKWLCNQDSDNISTVSQKLSQYCERNSDDKKLLINLCFIAYKFFECSNYKCSRYVLDLTMNILKEKRTDTKEKYYQLYLCKGLLLIKVQEFHEGLNVMVDGLKYLRTKLGKDMEKDISIATEFMNVGSILLHNEFYELGTNTLQLCLDCFEQYLPFSYDLWVDTVSLLGRFYNDSFDFTDSLMTLAPVFDYFHILNFGRIKKESKPVYQMAMEIGDKESVQKLSKKLKYPRYLPENISSILFEMMISFSGLGDQTSIFIIKSWISRCDVISKKNKRVVIDSCNYFGLVDIDRVIKEMKKNKKKHEALFNHLTIIDVSESLETTWAL